MSLQDDIFEVEDAVSETHAKEHFDRIVKRLGEVEAELEKLQDFYLTVRKHRAYMLKMDEGIKQNGA